MKRISILALFILAAVFYSLSCQKAPFITLNTPRSFTFTRDGGTQNITFTCNRDWSVSSSESWIQVSPLSGKASDGEITVKITCSANTTYDPRTATITIRVEELSETISISQDTGIGLIVSPKSLDLTNAAQTIEIEVQKNVQYSITIDDAGKDWITHAGTKALSSEKATFSIAANETYDNREGKITFKQTDGSLSETVVVRQSQTDGLIISSSDKEFNIGRDGETIGIKLQTNIDYEVIIPDEAKTWIEQVDTKQTKSLVDASVYLAVSENNTYYGRRATITIKKKEGELSDNVVISQAQTDALFITDENKEFSIPSKGGKIEINVFHNVPFKLEEDAIPNWINVSTSIVDTYNTKILVTVAENTNYVGRDVSVKLSAEILSDTFTIRQHQVDILYTDIKNYDATWKGGDLEVRVYSNVDYTCFLPSWINNKTESSSVEGPLNVVHYIFTIEENLDYSRDDVISFAWNNEGVDEKTIIQVHQESCVINLSFPGTLLDELGSERVSKIRVIKLCGSLNGTDVLVLKRMEKIDYLDLSDSHIVSGGRTYYGEYTTKDNIITSFALSGMNFSKLLLPQDIIQIEDYAIRDNPNLESIDVPSSVKSIGSTGLGYNYNMKEIKLHPGLQSLGSSVFESDYLVEELVIPEGVTTIGYHAFCWISSLKKVTLPSTLIKVEDRLFEIDDKIEEIHLKARPSSFTGIGTNLFEEKVYENATLYIPTGTKDDYYFSDFGRFKHIVEE